MVPAAPPRPDPNLIKIISGVADDVTKIDFPKDAAPTASTQPRQTDLALTVANADPLTYPTLTMVGTLTISDRFAGKNAREAQTGMTSYTFTQIRHDGTLGGSTTILFDKIFAHDLTIRAADPQDRGAALLVCIRFNFSTTLSLEKNKFLEQGQGTDWRYYEGKAGKWSNWRTDDDKAKAAQDQASNQAKADAAASAAQNSALLLEAIGESSPDKVKKYADATTVNVANSYGVMPLHLAIINGNLDMVKAIVAAGADVNALNGTRSPLTMATETRKLDIADFLKSHGAK